MLATENAQTLAEFQDNAAATLARLQKSGEPEVITVDGEPQAVMLSPEAFEEMTLAVNLAKDVSTIQQSIQDFKDGNFEDAEVFFERLHSELLAKKAERERGTSE